jgi:hypothetical protein
MRSSRKAMAKRTRLNTNTREGKEFVLRKCPAYGYYYRGEGRSSSSQLMMKISGIDASPHTCENSTS